MGSKAITSFAAGTTVTVTASISGVTPDGSVMPLDSFRQIHDTHLYFLFTLSEAHFTE